MNKQQRAAFAEPCFEAEECARPQFRDALMWNGRPWSVVLTANIGLE
jgi:hypothetical protein